MLLQKDPGSSKQFRYHLSTLCSNLIEHQASSGMKKTYENATYGATVVLFLSHANLAGLSATRYTMTILRLNCLGDQSVAARELYFALHVGLELLHV